MIKTCLHCQNSFDIAQSDLDFYTKISPVFAGQKFQIPSPTLCPDCRQRRRLSFRNERSLYRRTCDASGKQIVSMYSPDKPYKVYDQKIRWSDSRDAMTYARDFDFGKSFTENFDALMHEVPYPSMISIGSEMCDYTSFTLDSKESYMSSGITRSEKVLYSHFVRASDNITDCAMTYESSYCYQCVDCFKVYNCQYCQECNELQSCFLCVDCENCNHCLGCFGLEHQSYCYKNEPIGKEAFEALVKKIQSFDTLQTFKQELLTFIATQPARKANIILSENVTGNNIIESRNCTNCYDIKDCEECKNVYFTPHGRVSQDVVYTAPVGVEYCYEVCSTMVNNSAFCFLYWYGDKSYYMLYCINCSNCFGCVGLRDKSYCIFNKQYSKEEYENMVAKIIAHMQLPSPFGRGAGGEGGERGEFFHPSLSPFGYNETVAQEYYPIVDGRDTLEACPDTGCASSTSLQQRGYKRSFYEAPKPVSDKVIIGSDLPDTIEQVEDTILQYAIQCEVTGKLFRIQPQELVFYRKHGIPLPRKHPDQRHLERLQLRK